MHIFPNPVTLIYYYHDDQLVVKPKGYMRRMCYCCLIIDQVEVVYGAAVYSNEQSLQRVH